MHLKTSIAAIAAALSLYGCRREDIREFTVEIEDLVPARKQAVARALSRQPGIDESSFKWDFENRSLTLRYDSMQTAQTNIRMAIEERGFKVKYPEKTGPAGRQGR